MRAASAESGRPLTPGVDGVWAEWAECVPSDERPAERRGVDMLASVDRALLLLVRDRFALGGLANACVCTAESDG